MRVQVHEYENTFSTCALCPRINTVGTCCDPDDPGDTRCTGGDRCDNVLFYCLMPLGNVPDNTIILSMVDLDGNPITRATGLGCLQPSTALRSNENRDNDFLLNPGMGLTNPLVFEVTAVRWQVSVLTQLLYMYGGT